MNYAVGKGAFVAVAAGNEFEDGNPIEALADWQPHRRRDAGRRGRPRSDARLLLEHRIVGRGQRAGRQHRARAARRRILQQTFDPVASVSDPLDAPVSVYRAPRFDTFRYEAPSRARRWRRRMSPAWWRC